MHDTTFTAQARRLRQQLRAEFGVTVTHAQALSFLARSLGYRTYEALHADRAATPPPEVTPVPAADPRPANATVYVALRVHAPDHESAADTTATVKNALLRAIEEDGPDAFITRLDFDPDAPEGEPDSEPEDPVEEQWSFVGGPLIDKVEDGHMSTEDAAAEFEGEYGHDRDWQAYIRAVLFDRSEFKNGRTRTDFLRAYHGGPWTADAPTPGRVTLRLPFGVNDLNEAVLTLRVNAAGGVDVRDATLTLHHGTPSAADPTPAASVPVTVSQVHRLLICGPDATALRAWFAALTQARAPYAAAPYPPQTPTVPCPACQQATRAPRPTGAPVTCEHCTHTWTPVR